MYSVKMNKGNITFGKTEIEKRKFYHYKCPINISNEDIYKIIISNKISVGKKKSLKYFIGCKHDEKVKPLSIMLLK